MGEIQTLCKAGRHRYLPRAGGRSGTDFPNGRRLYSSDCGICLSMVEREESLIHTECTEKGTGGLPVPSFCLGNILRDTH